MQRSLPSFQVLQVHLSIVFLLRASLQEVPRLALTDIKHTAKVCEIESPFMAHRSSSERFRYGGRVAQLGPTVTRAYFVHIGIYAARDRVLQHWLAAPVL